MKNTRSDRFHLLLDILKVHFANGGLIMLIILFLWLEIYINYSSYYLYTLITFVTIFMHILYIQRKFAFAFSYLEMH